MTDLNDDVEQLLSRVTKLVVPKYEEPFWNESIENLSERFWLPSSDDKPRDIDTHSWFSQTFIPANAKSQYIQRVIMNAAPKGYRTLKLRVFLNAEQKALFSSWTGAFRWIYNYTVDILKLYFEGRAFDTQVRDFIRHTNRLEELVTTENAKLCFINYIKTKKNEFPVPEWMEKLKLNNRAYRGAIKNCVANWNSAVQNKARGNISRFSLGYRSKKDQNYFLSFEDWCRTREPLPKSWGSLRGWYKKGRVKIDAADLFSSIPHKAITLWLERTTGRYYLLMPVPITFNPTIKGKIRGSTIATDIYRFTPGENQAWSKRTMIALDPGVRTFQTGYAPEGLFQFGNGARRRLILMLLRADRYQAKGTPKARRQRLRTLSRVRNLVTDLHWKTINQLCSFRTVFLPSFSVSQMVKGTKLARSTKRLLQVFRYWDFQQKLLWKASLTGTQVHIVNESWTSKTCTSCGEIKKDLTGEETFECSFCGLKIGRDYQGARNIFLKSYSALY